MNRFSSLDLEKQLPAADKQQENTKNLQSSKVTSRIGGQQRPKYSQAPGKGTPKHGFPFQKAVFQWLIRAGRSAADEVDQIDASGVK